MKYSHFKRLVDLVISMLILILFLPLLIPIVIALKFTAEGAVWYFQKRVGFQSKPFKIWKFATMLRDSPNLLTGSLTVRNDPRVTPVGRYLRLSKINEIPQIINVIKGEMSLVGPRPQMQEDFEAFPKFIQERIYHVKPGITGIGSIIFRDEEKYLSENTDDPKLFYAEVIAPYKGAVEMWYQENISLATDLKILLCTALVIIIPDLSIHKYFPGLPALPGALQTG